MLLIISIIHSPPKVTVLKKCIFLVVAHGSYLAVQLLSMFISFAPCCPLTIFRPKYHRLLGDKVCGSFTLRLLVVIFFNCLNNRVVKFLIEENRKEVQ